MGGSNNNVHSLGEDGSVIQENDDGARKDPINELADQIMKITNHSMSITFPSLCAGGNSRSDSLFNKKCHPCTTCTETLGRLERLGFCVLVDLEGEAGAHQK